MATSRSAAEFFEFVNRRDIDRMRDHLNDDAHFLFPKTQPLVGKERILKFFQILFRQYPQLTFDVQGIVAEGDRAAVHWAIRGANRRGECYENEGVTLFHFEGGKVSFMSDFFKDTGRF
jgi:ketosteroid isomerase-like protein